MTVTTSKIKEVFGDELIKMIAAVCQTRRIESNAKKMKVIYGLLNEAGIDYEPLGDATNRLAIQKDAYAFKIALDQAGYKDNWMEYALTEELQPYVTYTYETNGYIAVAECVKSLSEDEFFSRKSEMTKILDVIGGEYLLGDVGITRKQYKNWGVRDSGELVILDYAYVHRATEELFLCSVCGEILRYNEAFTSLSCLGRDGCGTSFDYSAKRAQIPDSKIQEVIDDAKSASILMSEPRVELHDYNGVQLDPNSIVITSFSDYEKYLKEANTMCEVEDGIGAMLKVIQSVKEGKPVGVAIKENLGESSEKNVIIGSIVTDEFFDDDGECQQKTEPLIIYDPESTEVDIDQDEEDQAYSSLLDKIKNANIGGTEVSTSPIDESNQVIVGDIGVPTNDNCDNNTVKPKPIEPVEQPCGEEEKETVKNAEYVKNNSRRHIVIG